MASDEIERWLPVVGFEGLYEVSNFGRVASLPSPGTRGRSLSRRILKAAVLRKRGGYLFVNLHRGGRSHNRRVHRLVCEAFHGPRPDGLLTRHLNGNVLDNTPGNLAWGTYSMNLLDTVRHGRHHNAVKLTCKNDHPLFGDNLYMNPTSGARQCRVCQGLAKAKYAAKKRSERNAS